MANAKHRISSMRTIGSFLKRGTWSETVMSVLDHADGYPMQPEEHATMSLAGGIMNYGYQCGMLWGAALAAGAQAYRLHGAGPRVEAVAIKATQKVVESFRGCTKNEINCLEITDLNMQGRVQITKIMKFFIKGGPIGCVRMITKYSPRAYSQINASLAEKQERAPKAPVSCTTLLAQKMGASELHAIMAAGLAGGIGLSGGGCGALGAAIWILGMNGAQEGISNKAMSKMVSDMIERFLKSTDYKFECAEIVGREFKNINDHAKFIRGGGCDKIIEVFAAESSEA